MVSGGTTDRKGTIGESRELEEEAAVGGEVSRPETGSVVTFAKCNDVELTMCYSAQIWADFRKYERFGGKLAIKEFTKLAGWTKAKGNWVKVVPKAMRRAMPAAISVCRS